MLIRISYLFVIAALAIGATLFVYFTRDASVEQPRYAGVERCVPCHASENSGAQYVVWQQGPHSDAFASLSGDSARAYLSDNDAVIEDCLPCHTTLGRAPLNPQEQHINAQGVGCERCHGPGSRYAFFNVMGDSLEYLERGGVVGRLDDCYGCHVPQPDSAAVHCPFQTEDFVADSAWPSIRHPISNERTETILDLRADEQ
jgi:hypothetical protein